MSAGGDSSPRIIRASDFDFEDRFGDPTMLGADELTLYHVAASQHEAGIVVEIGPWLGGGTRAVCLALEKSDRPYRLFAVDTFKWLPYHAERFGSLCSPGESFLPRFEKNTAGFKGAITAVPGSYTEAHQAIPSDLDIGTLFIDGPRSWSALRTVLLRYAGQLKSGSRIVLEGAFVLAAIDMTFLTLLLPVRLEALSEGGSGASYVVEGDIRSALQAIPAAINNAAVDAIQSKLGSLSTVLPIAKVAALIVGLCIDRLARNDHAAAEDIFARYLKMPMLREAATDSLRSYQKSAKGKNSTLAPVILNALRYNSPLAKPTAVAGTDSPVTPADLAKAAEELTLPKSEIARLKRIRQAEANQRSWKRVFLKVLSPKLSPKVGSSELLDRLEMKDVLTIGQGIGSPRSVRELAALFAANNPTIPISSLMEIQSSFKLALESGDFASLMSLRSFLAGRRVLDLCHPTVERSVIVKALGATEYFGAVAPGETPPSAPAVDGLGFGSPPDKRQFEVALEQFDSREAIVDRIAFRLQRLAPGGRLIVSVSNPRGVLAETKAGRKAWETNLTELELAPKLGALRESIGSHFEILVWNEEFHTPEVVENIDASLLRRHHLEGRELIVKRVLFAVQSHPPAIQQPVRKLGSYARRKG